jgi:hypothetical protein
MQARRTAYLLFALVSALLAVAIAPIASAQSQNLDTCPAIVNNALTQVGVNCAGMARNTACYGFRAINKGVVRGDVAPNYTWTPDQPELGSRIELTTTETVQTGPFDLLNRRWGLSILEIQANLPNTLPTPGVRMMALGGVEVENGVEPEEALILPPAGVAVNTTRATTMRNNPDAPGWASRIIDSIPAAALLEVDVVSADEGWVRVVFNGRPGWIRRGDISTIGDLSLLPRVGPETYTPYQDFYFRVGIGGIRCEDAPSLLFIQSPKNPVLSTAAAPKDDMLLSPAEQSATIVPIAAQMRLWDQDIEVEGSIVARTIPIGDENVTVGNTVELINLFGILRIYPDTPGEIIVPPGFATRLGLADVPASLGIEGDADEKTPIGRFGQPFPLSAAELAALGIIGQITSSTFNIFDTVVIPPRVLQISGVGGTVPVIVCSDANQCAEAQEFCANGQLPQSICEQFAF